MGGDRQGTTREAERVREVGREGIQDTRKTRVVRVDAAAGGVESGAVGGLHGLIVEERFWHSLTYEGRTSTLLLEEEYSPNCRQKNTKQVMNTCAGCCITACTARGTPHKIGRKSLRRHSATSSWEESQPVREARPHQGRTYRGNRARGRRQQNTVCLSGRFG